MSESIKSESIKKMPYASGPVVWPQRATPENFRDPAFAESWSLGNSAPTAPKDEPKLVREEFGQESDINNVVNRYGPLTRMPGADDYGEFDLTKDLTDHFQAAKDLSEGWDRLPKHIKARYTLMDFMGALARGEDLDLSPEPVQEPKKEPEPAPKSDNP